MTYLTIDRFPDILPTKQQQVVNGRRKEVIDSILTDEFETFAAHLAKRITSRHNKDVRLLVVGEPGSGKSRTLLYLAWRLSEEVAKLKGGSPDDYFNIGNVGVITAEDIIDKMNNLHRYCIYILDDAGVAWDSRDFATRGNKNLNHILQTCRTANAAILISVPDPKLIDVQVTDRGLIQYWAEVSESLHDYGKNLVKIFRLKRLFRAGKMLYMHPRYGDNKIVRYEARNPPETLIHEYEEMRRACAADAGSKYEDKGKSDRQAKREAEKQLRETHMVTAWDYVMKEGLTINKAISRLNRELREAGVNRKYPSNALTRWRDGQGL
jgi:hypothetical protein